MFSLLFLLSRRKWKIGKNVASFKWKKIFQCIAEELTRHFLPKKYIFLLTDSFEYFKNAGKPSRSVFDACIAFPSRLKWVFFDGKVIKWKPCFSYSCSHAWYLIQRNSLKWKVLISAIGGKMRGTFLLFSKLSPFFIHIDWVETILSKSMFSIVYYTKHMYSFFPVHVS